MLLRDEVHIVDSPQQAVEVLVQLGGPVPENRILRLLQPGHQSAGGGEDVRQGNTQRPDGGLHGRKLGQPLCLHQKTVVQGADGEIPAALRDGRRRTQRTCVEQPAQRILRRGGAAALQEDDAVLHQKGRPVQTAKKRSVAVQ